MKLFRAAMCSIKEHILESPFNSFPAAWVIVENLVCPTQTSHKFVIVLNYFWLAHRSTLSVLFCLHKLCCV